jgi:hypothetical protein
MSEYQYVIFRAIDRPVSPEDLKFMRKQSSRADVTAWSFENEYHYGDFGGNAKEMLRRGYDLHLHYANFGERTLMIWIPDGLPDEAACRPYFGKESLEFVKDKDGPGGILVIEPHHEPGDLDDLWDFGPLVERLLPLRAEILGGDLRPLYLAHLAVAGDMNHDPEETEEGPVPAGLDRLTDAQKALCELYQLSDPLITAAAQEAPPMAAGDDDAGAAQAAWVKDVPAARKDEWLTRLITDSEGAVRREVAAAFRKARPASTWPTVVRGRTIAELEALETELAKVAERRAADRAARERAKRLAKMAADPSDVLRKAEELVATRSGEAYTKVGRLLAELREALAGTERASLAEEHARALRDRNPTLRLLVSELRKKGFLPK